MHGPDVPPGSSPGPAGFEDAREAVQAVIARYNAQIMAERRATAPDQKRLAQLQEERAAALADLRALDDVETTDSADAAARIAALYEARRNDP